MRTKILRIRMAEPDFETVKKRAVTEGKNVSETIRDLVRIGLRNRSGPGEGSDLAIAPETVRKAVEGAVQAAGLGELKAEIRALERTLFDARKTDPGSGETSGFAWTKSQAGFLIYTVACISKFFEEYNAAWNANDQQKLMRRTDLVDESGLREVQKYLPGWKKRRGENE